MPTLLTLKKLRAIHLVDKGAAIGSRVVFSKRISRAKESVMSLKKRISDAIAKALENVMKEETPASAAGKTPQELVDTALEAEGVSEAGKAAIMAAVGAMLQATPPIAAPAPAPAAPDKAEDDQPKPDDDKPAPTEDELAAKAKDDEMKEENLQKILKSLDPNIQSALVPILKAKADAELRAEQSDERAEKSDKRIDELEETVAESVAKRELGEMVEVAKQFAFVPGEIEKRAALLVSVKKNQGDDAFDALVESFKAANDLVKKGKHRSPGTSREDVEKIDETEAAEADDKLQEMAKELVEKSDTKLSPQQAFKRVIKTEKGKRLWKLSKQHQQSNLH